MYASEIKLFSTKLLVGKITSIPGNINNQTFNTVFYGRGKGIHSTSLFTGTQLKQLIQNYYPLNRENLQSGIFCLAGIDGYRCAVSYLELFNRNDQQEFLLVKTQPNENGGLFRIFAACDFFSDRAIKSVSEIHLGF
jgi:hypothetical protein